MSWEQILKLEDFSAQRDENTKRLRELLGEDLKDAEFSQALDNFKNKWNTLKPEIDKAYNTLWNYAAKNTYSKGWNHKPAKPNPPYSSPAQFFHFLKRFFDVRRYGRKAHTSDPNRYGKQRYYPREESSYPSKEFNRRWKTWEEIRWGKGTVKESLDRIFSKLGWFQWDVVIRGIDGERNEPPYTFMTSGFKEWRLQQKYLASGKNVPIAYDENDDHTNLRVKRR